MEQLFCKYCGSPISETDFYCPHCGKKLKNPPASLKPLSLIWLLILSTLLPPLGIGVTIRYIRDSDERARTIGWISLIVTVFVVVTMIVLSIDAYNNLLQTVNSQMGGYQF